MEISVSNYNFLSKKEIGDITIYDSTLRDGEQMPGVAFNSEQKLAIAKMLSEIGIRQIEAGFPAVSEGERNAIKKITKENLNSEILALSRLSKKDVDYCLQCNVDFILLFIATSNIHLKYKLKCTKDEIKEKMVEVIEYAKKHGLKVSFSTEDSTRTELQFLKEIYKFAESLKVNRVGIADTVGCISIEGISFLTKEISKTIRVPLSAHLHNDFGLALANSLIAVQNGARAIATTINGIGERAGNVPLEEFVIALKILYGKDLGIKTEKLFELSKLVEKFSKVKIHKNKPLVGRNVFSHESGIHVSAVINNPITYESIPPELVGNKRRFILGKHSGIFFVKYKLEKKGIKLEEEKLEKILMEVKIRGEENGFVSEKDFWNIVKKFNTTLQPS